MAKRRNRGITRPITIPIRTLSGGVGRQAPSKRLPTEAENLDNCFVTLERSIEKRNGFEFVTRSDSQFDGLDLDYNEEQDFFVFWLQVSDVLRYLVMLDFKARDTSKPLLYLYKLTFGNNMASVPFTYTPTESERAYLTFGSEDFSARDSLRVVNVGANVVILNKNVRAGFSSNAEGKMFDLNGVVADIEDEKGAEDVYETAIEVDPLGEAEPWNVYGNYLEGDLVLKEGNPDGQGTRMWVWRLGIDYIQNDKPNAWHNTNTGVRPAEFINVKDYRYPDTTKPHLGQSLANISEIKFPPSADDVNNTRNGAESKIANNYPNIGNSEGKGKIFYLSTSFGAVSPGYYRVKDNEKTPYLHKILTPESFSVLDENRMPHKIYIEDSGSWRISAVDWDPRTGGTNDTNPGISVFKDEEGNPKQVPLSSMAFYRDRLFISSFDTIFSSSMGDYTDFWIEDPSNIVATDPIDVQASANKFTPIISMIPFSDFLFINTDSDVQYELLGSENQITPFTAELSPTSFYSTSPMVDPQLMGSQIYFYSPQRMYLYFSNRVNNINKAVEVSAHCPEYLPKTFRAPAVAPTRDTIYVVDDENRNEIYGYTNRFSGDQVVQNAFFRYTLDDDIEIFNIQIFDDEMYLLITMRTATDAKKYYLVKMPLQPQGSDEPRIDLKHSFVIDTSEATRNTTYDEASDETFFTLPVSDTLINECIFYEGWDNEDDVRTSPIYVPEQSNSDVAVYKLKGNFEVPGAKIHFGRSFTMTVELSPQFMRDDNNNVIDGVLNMRTLHLRHAKTGNYRIEASRRGRAPVVSTFDAAEVDNRQEVLPLRQWESDGEFVAQVMGFGAETTIKIISDYPTPVNITQMELKGKFKSIHSTALT